MKIVADINIPLIKSAFKGLGEIEVLDKFSITSKAVRDADALLVRSETRVNRDLLDGSKVRFVATATSGIDHIDVDYLQDAGIGFSDALGCNANSVAEYIMVALLHLSCKHNFPLQGKSMGVIGVGNVGAKVVRNARALGMEVLQNDPPRQRALHARHRVRENDDAKALFGNQQDLGVHAVVGPTVHDDLVSQVVPQAPPQAVTDEVGRRPACGGSRAHRAHDVRRPHRA